MGMSAQLAAATLASSLNTAYLALFADDPGEDGTIGELSGGAYERVRVTFDAVDPHTSTSTTMVEFPPAAEDWPQVNYIALFTAGVGGDLLYSSQLYNPITIRQGAIARISVGGLSVYVG